MPIVAKNLLNIEDIDVGLVSMIPSNMGYIIHS